MKLIHIKQGHRLPFGIKPSTEYIENTIKSQFKVAQELIKLSNYPIVVESLYEDFPYSANLPISLAAMRIFPNGFPKNLEDLSSLQREFLYKEGAAATLLYLGKISIIYKSIHKEVSHRIDKEILEGDFNSMLAPRDIEAVDCAKEAAIKRFKDISHATVVVVFGALHNFKKYCDEQGFEYEVIDTTTDEKNKAYDEDVKSNFIEPPQEFKAVELQKALNDSGMLNDCLTKGYVTFEKLVELQQNKPWIIDALRCSNINKGIINNYIRISQLECLTKEQVGKIVHKYHDKELQIIVETYREQAISRFETKTSPKESERTVEAIIELDYDFKSLFFKHEDKQKNKNDNTQEQTSTIPSLSYSPLIEDVD